MGTRGGRITANNLNTLGSMSFATAAPTMIWLKSALTGSVAAIAAIVIIVAATATLSISGGQGSGRVGFVIVSASPLLLVPALLAFVLAFRWMYRRQRRRMTHSR